MSTSHFGAVAAWWQRHKGDLAKEAIIGLAVGVLLLIGGWVWEARLQARQDALERAIANRQDDLARSIADRQDALASDLANQAEVLENTRFSGSSPHRRAEIPKPFASINLRLQPSSESRDEDHWL